MASFPRVAPLVLAVSVAAGGANAAEPVRERLLPENRRIAVTTDHQPFEPLIRVAVDDLARRLNVNRADIQVLEARAVVWPDRSLGCQRPGMVYPQVLTEGALIRLQAQGREFAYHSGGSRPPFLCEKQR